MNDALGRCSRLQYVCCHHEQACAMAGEAYARVSGRMGVVSVTTGPGGINALNGVFGACTGFDSNADHFRAGETGNVPGVVSAS